MYRMLNRCFKVTNLNTLETKTYNGMRQCSTATKISYFKLNRLCSNLDKNFAFLEGDDGVTYKVEVTPETKEVLIEAIPENPEYFSNIKFSSVTRLVKQFGISKTTIYRKWKEAYPVYEDNPTELIIKYYQSPNKDYIKCKIGNAYGEKFLLRFYKPYPEDHTAFENHKGYCRNLKRGL